MKKTIHPWRISISCVLLAAVLLAAPVAQAEEALPTAQEAEASYWNTVMQGDIDRAQAELKALPQELLNQVIALNEAEEGAALQPDSGTCKTGLTWALDENGTLTISGTGPMEDYTPDSPAPWAKYHSHILRVEVEKGVSSIGDLAFFRCTALREVSLPSDLAQLGRLSFYGCQTLTGILLPAELKGIGPMAFWQCTSLSSISLPSYISVLEPDTFRDCRNLTGVQLPVGMTKISRGAFSGCAKLSSAVLPLGLAVLGQDAFRGCESLLNISIPSGISEIAPGCFAECSKLRTISLPGTLTAIGDSAFEGCTAISGITLPANLQVLGCGSFRSCTGLIQVSAPCAIAELPQECFAGCTSLRSIPLPETLTAVGSRAFLECKALTELRLPEKLQRIGEAAFMGSGIANFEFPGAIPELGEDAFRDVTAVVTHPCTMAEWATVAEAYEGLTDKPIHPMAGHITLPALDASCTEAGHKAGTACPDCGGILTGGEVIPALEHKYETEADTVCSVCGADSLEAEIAEPAEAAEAPAQEAVAALNDNEEAPAEDEEAAEEAEVPESDAATASEEPEAAKEDTEEAAAEVPAREEPEETSEDAYTPTMVISADPSMGKPGNTMVVTLNLRQNPGIISAAIQVDYDPAVLELIESEDLGLLRYASFCEFEAGTCLLSWAEDTARANQTGRGALARLTFHIRKDAPLGTYSIHISGAEADSSALDWDLNSIPLESTQAAITVTETLYGDVNGDGLVNSKDRVLLARTLAGWKDYPVTELDGDAADVNADGKVDEKDLEVLQNHLLHRPEYSVLPYRENAGK